MNDIFVLTSTQKLIRNDQHCENTGCNLEDRPLVMARRSGLRENQGTDSVLSV